MMKIKLMPDYGCDPLWDIGETGPRNIPPASLSLSGQLTVDLVHWAGKYDQTLNREDPTKSGFPTRDDQARFVEEGRRLARRLADELALIAEVAYQDIDDDHVYPIPPGAPAERS